MQLPKLIILYGAFGTKHNAKQQRMIDGDCVCGYRDYARKFGEIIYLSPQDVRLPWEHSIPDADALTEYLGAQENAVVWSVKHDPAKDEVLKTITHLSKLYYSCCSRDMYNPYVDLSLVDTVKRRDAGPNCCLWFKGKDRDFWYRENTPTKYDYCLCGRRGDKREVDFINLLTEDVQDVRSVVWIGGAAHKGKWNKTHHNVTCTEFTVPSRVRNLMSASRVGVIMTEHPSEGFPQAAIEMSMCGLPVIYNERGPWNDYYMMHMTMCLARFDCSVGMAEFHLNTNQPGRCKVDIEDSYMEMLGAIRVNSQITDRKRGRR